MESFYFYNHHYHTPSEMSKRFLFSVQDVGWYKCGRDYHMNRTFNHFQIKFVVSGSGYVVTQGKKWKVEENELFFLDLSNHHEYYSDSDKPWELLWVRFNGIQTMEFYHLLECGKKPIFQVRDGFLVKELFQELYDLFSNRPPGTEFIASTIISRVLTELVVTKMEGDRVNLFDSLSAYPDEIQKAIIYIEKNYQTQISIDDLANLVHLSPYHFCRIFKRSTGCTVAEYILKHRLKLAKQYAFDTKYTLGEIAQMVGFGSQSYFTKMFKLLEGMTPNEYRRKLR